MFGRVKAASVRRSKWLRRLREDSEALWHARSGYLAVEALQTLVYNVKGVWIKGTAQVKCTRCAQTHVS